MKRSPVTLLFATVALSMVAASASDAMPLSPSDMTSALERKIVSGAGVMYPGSIQLFCGMVQMTNTSRKQNPQNQLE